MEDIVFTIPGVAPDFVLKNLHLFEETILQIAAKANHILPVVNNRTARILSPFKKEQAHDQGDDLDNRQRRIMK